MSPIIVFAMLVSLLVNVECERGSYSGSGAISSLPSQASFINPVDQQAAVSNRQGEGFAVQQRQQGSHGFANPSQQWSAFPSFFNQGFSGFQQPQFG